MSRGVLAVLKYVFASAAIVFAAWFAARNADAVESALLSLPPLGIIGAGLLTVAGYLCRFAAWRVVSRACGLRSGFREDSRAWFLSYLGRYVPGNAGLAAVRLTAYPPSSTGAVATATVVEYGLTLGSASLAILAGMPWLHRSLPGWVPAVVASFAALLLAATSPPLVRRSTALAARLLRRIGGPAPDPASHARALLLALAGSALHGAAFAILALPGLEPDAPMVVASISGYFLGGLAGALFILSPAGLGVREGVTMLALAPLLGSGPVLVAAGAMRGITLVSEALLLGIASLCAPRGSR
jgi:hypothetical protein